ncbi:hypothetical protein VKT23_020451 [Stygiomarasmius scandens]|uniref:Uncharacterized protein n=1 Tax=Marasmiellus scandens TaxID=2682957 RepID=A0ABR1IJ35_9AGAR
MAFAVLIHPGAQLSTIAVLTTLLSRDLPPSAKEAHSFSDLSNSVGSSGLNSRSGNSGRIPLDTDTSMSKSVEVNITRSVVLGSNDGVAELEVKGQEEYHHDHDGVVKNQQVV